ncbi:MAG TPA: shikimate dehydrogenase [Acidimicrobiales bacterium]|nr:shikimate dehydrogenase [Acidimicrobiales bacterium]
MQRSPSPPPPGSPAVRPQAAWPAGTTAVVGVVGDPVRHSLSPVIHNAVFAHLGMDWVFVALPVAAGSGREALAGAKALSLRGLAVTMPHKQIAAEVADRRDPAVELLAAANTLVFDDGVSTAYSTDGAGFLADLREGAGFDPKGAVCAVLGAGGAARSVVVALAAAGAEAVLVVNRSPAGAAAAAALAGAAGSPGRPEDLPAADLVVNATPVGMRGTPATHGSGGGATTFDPAELLRAGQVVYDLVYHPAETALLRAGAAAGARVRGGLGMLVHQAAAQFELFTGRPAPLEVMWEAVGNAVGAR